MQNIFGFLKALVLYFLIIIGIGFIYYKFVNLNYYFLNRMVEFVLFAIMYYIINRYFLKMEIKFAFIISLVLTICSLAFFDFFETLIVQRAFSNVFNK